MPVIAAMYYETVLYHVYNQSNNYEALFCSERNYRYFQRKIARHLGPYSDVLCYCLMPDHFHLLLKPNRLGCMPSRSRRYLRHNEDHQLPAYQQNLSSAIKTLLSSYTLAVNKERGRRGSLFKAKTKAKPGFKDFIPEVDELSCDIPFTRYVPYLHICFDYIHNNPVKAQLVKNAVHWPYSSAAAYAGSEDCEICNFALAEQLLGIRRGPLKASDALRGPTPSSPQHPDQAFLTSHRRPGTGQAAAF